VTAKVVGPPDSDNEGELNAPVITGDANTANGDTPPPGDESIGGGREGGWGGWQRATTNGPRPNPSGGGRGERGGGEGEGGAEGDEEGDEPPPPSPRPTT
jgi:hypothetical protein